jgi:hypothetical protein
MTGYWNNVEEPVLRRPEPPPSPPKIVPANRSGFPTLLIQPTERLTPEALSRIADRFRNMGPGEVIVLTSPSLRIYQLVDGLWQPLGTK